MLHEHGTEEKIKVELDNFEHGFPDGFGPGRWGHLAYAIGIAFATFQLFIAAWNFLHPMFLVRVARLVSIPPKTPEPAPCPVG